MDDVGIAPARHRLGIDVYHRMVEAGIFGKEDRIELLDGDLIDMAPIGQGHEAAVDGLTEAFVLACRGRAIVRVQSSIRLDGWSAPEPDLAILRRRADFYATGTRPGPADVLLLVEVAGSSLRYDKEVKLPLYARAGIPEAWIVDLNARVVAVHREPAGDTYGTVTTHQAGEVVTLAAADIEVRLDIVFG